MYVEGLMYICKNVYIYIYMYTYIYINNKMDMSD